MMMNRAALEAHIKATPITGTVAEKRNAFELLAGDSLPVEMQMIGGVPCGIFGQGVPVIWFHGGGYVFGSARSHANGAVYLATALGCQIIIPEYRLAPEHPWPAQLDDAVAVCKALGGQVPLIGDSAGGHLALNLAMQPDLDIPALVLISPNTDRTGQNILRAANSATDLMNDDKTDAALAANAFAHLPPDNPHVSPILFDLTKLPPVYLTAARNEVLYGDAVILNNLATADGVSVHFDVVEDMFHMWTLWPTATAQAISTYQAIGSFLDDHLAS